MPRDDRGMERLISLAPATWAALDQIAQTDRFCVQELVRDASHRDWPDPPRSQLR